MKKTNKTETDTPRTPAERMRELAEKAKAEKYAAVRVTKTYAEIKAAVDKYIEQEALKGETVATNISGAPLVKDEADLKRPKTVMDVVAECEDPDLVMETVFHDLEAEGYVIMRCFGFVVGVSWAKPEEA